VYLFPSLGLAVLGIFTTVVLVGVLAGVIAFGLVERGLRRRAQGTVVRQLVDDPIRRALENENRPPESVGGLEYRWPELMAALRELASSHDILARLLRLDPGRLYGLPYRQLCGQIANAMGAEFPVEGERELYSPLQMVTIALALAERASNEEHSFMPFSVAHTPPRRRAMQFLDTLQIALAEAVLASARQCAGWTILFILAVAILPGLAVLNIFAGDPSIALRAIGGIIGIACATVLIFALAYAASIIAEMTFRLVDRSATAR
jgi:hypothetical protein